MDASRLLSAERACGVALLRLALFRAVSAQGQVPAGDEHLVRVLLHADHAERNLGYVALRGTLGLKPRHCGEVPATIAHPNWYRVARQGWQGQSFTAAPSASGHSASATMVSPAEDVEIFLAHLASFLFMPSGRELAYVLAIAQVLWVAREDGR